MENAKGMNKGFLMITISQLAKRFRLSRSTLLYYDAQGVLSPCGRTAAGYRQYDENDAVRLEKICLYRGAGLPLRDIRQILDAPEKHQAFLQYLGISDSKITKIRSF